MALGCGVTLEELLKEVHIGKKNEGADEESSSG